MNLPLNVGYRLVDEWRDMVRELRDQRDLEIKTGFPITASHDETSAVAIECCADALEKALKKSELSHE